MGKGKNYISIVIVLGILAFGIPLTLYGINGSSMRYSGDDYCYAAVFARYGFWEAQWRSYWQSTTYHGNRYSLTLFSHLADTIGPKANGWLPGLALTSWVIALIFVFRYLARIAAHSMKIVEALLLAEAMVFLTIHRTPDIAQSLYWRSGMLPYLAPLVFNAILFVVFLLGLQGRKSFFYGLVLFLLSLLSGGFSETGLAFQVGIWVAIPVGMYIFFERDKFRSRRVLGLISMVWLGSLAAFLLLALSPVTKARLASLPTPPNFPDLVKMCFLHAKIFAAVTKKQMRENIVIITFFVAYAFYYFSHQPQRPQRLLSIVWRLTFVFGGGLFLLLACMAPSAYAASSYPELRALVLARFVIVAIMGAAGWIAGEVIRGLIQPRPHFSWLPAISLVLLGTLYVYPLLCITEIRTNTPLYQKWARFWDARDQEIRSLAQQGYSEVHVVQIDHVIPNVAELSPDAEHWYTNCAEMYYGVRAIYADQGGWDEEKLPPR